MRRGLGLCEHIPGGAGRQLDDVLHVLDALVVQEVAGHDGHRQRRIRDALLIAPGGHDDLFQHPTGAGLCYRHSGHAR